MVPAPSQSARRNGAPTSLAMQARSKAGPPARRKTVSAGVRDTRPFARCAKERGTHFIGDASKVKGWATRRRRTVSAGVRDTRPFAKCAKERGTHFIGDASKVKGWATRLRRTGQRRRPWYPPLRKVREGTGHPLHWLGKRGQRLGNPPKKSKNPASLMARAALE